MSRYTDIDALLTSLGEGATVEQVEYALRDHITREVLAVLADRAAAGGGGTSFPDEWTIGEAGELDVPELTVTNAGGEGSGGTTFTLDDAGFLLDSDTNATLWVLGENGTDAFIRAQDNDSFREARLQAGTGPGFGGVRFHDGDFTRVLLNDVVFLLRINAAPADGDLAANQVSLWFDSTDGAAKLKIKGKSANGTVVTGEVPLG